MGVSRRLGGWLRVLFLGCSAAVSATAAAVEEFSGVSEEDFLMEVPVVLSAARLQQPKAEAPVAVTVIDRGMIEASGAQEIHELFRLVPGFTVAHYLGHRPLVTNHGLSDQFSRRMQVLIDGRSVYMPAFGGVPWADLPVALEDIERIEVIRGPNSATYGSNAFLGIISIITRHAVESPGWTAKWVAGEGGQARSLLRYGGNRGDLDFRFTAGHQDDDGLDGRLDGKRLGMFSGRVDYRDSNLDLWELQFGYKGGDRDSYSPGEFEDPAREYSGDSHYQQLRWLRVDGPGSELSVQFSHTYHEIEDAFISGEILPGVTTPLELSHASRRYALEFQQVATPAENIRVVWGVGAGVDQATMPLYLGRPDAVENRIERLFGHAEWRPAPDWLISAGGMAEHTTFTGEGFSPRLAVNHQFLPGHTLRASVSRATRMPAVLEDQADTAVSVTLPAPLSLTLRDQIFYGDGRLTNEVITSREIGYVGYFLDRSLSVDGRLFKDQVRDLITPTFAPYPDDNDSRAEVMRNNSWVDVEGLELQLDYRPDADSRIVLGYSYVDIDGVNLGTPYAFSAPRHTLSLLADHRLSGDRRISAAYYYVDPMLYLGEGDFVPEQRRLDLRFSQGLRFAGGTRGEVNLALRNVTGRYTDFRRENFNAPQAYLELVLQTD